MYSYMYIHICNVNTYLFMYNLFMYNMYTCIYVYTYMYIYMYTYMHMCVCMYVCKCIDAIRGSFSFPSFGTAGLQSAFFHALWKVCCVYVRWCACGSIHASIALQTQLLCESTLCCLSVHHLNLKLTLPHTFSSLLPLSTLSHPLLFLSLYMNTPPWHAALSTQLSTCHYHQLL